jgi:hypothetical protein
VELRLASQDERFNQLWKLVLNLLSDERNLDKLIKAVTILR